MARIRNIKPEFFDDEGLGTVSLGARLCFIGLWTQADKAGRLEDRPARLKVRLFPFDADLNVATLVDELCREGCVQRYRVQGKPYLLIPKFNEHQYLSKREPESTLPGIDQSETGPVPVLDETQTGTTDIGHRTRDIGQGTCVAPTNGAHPPIPFAGGSLHGGSHRAHASCGRVCVPAFLHQEFRQLVGGDESKADSELRAHYRAWWAALPESAVVTQPLDWLRGRFAETYADKAAPVKPDKRAMARARDDAAMREFLSKP